jgi:glycopeptide antibiotics resistance protein
MEYAMLFKDYGQGGLTAVPVSQCTGEHKPDYRRPYTVYEVLTDFFGEDMSLVLGNYLKQEIGTVRRQKGMKKARQARLLSYYYLTTRSRTQQPVNETLVDFIIRGKVEAETEEKDRFVREMDFRVRYILDLRPCEQKCIGPLIFLKEEEDPASEDGIPANDYLLPILRAKDYETVAHQILRKYYPEYASRLSEGERFVMNGDDLAARMNLDVRDVHFADPATLGQIYYNFGDAELLVILNLLGKTRFRQGLSVVALTFYLTFVFGSTVFTRDPGQFMAPNFNLFLSYRAMLASQSYLAAKGIVLNMLLLMPIGLLLPIILQKRFFLWPVLVGFGCSLAIELMQYYFHCGMFDVDDLLNNTLGVWIGYLIYWVVTWIPYFRKNRNQNDFAALRKIG